MCNREREFHACLFPMMLQGHTIPFLSTALVFAKHGAKVTIITTPTEASHLSNLLSPSDPHISFLTIAFPSEKAEFISDDNVGNNMERLFQGVPFLSSSLETILREHKPNCLVADTFFPWCIDVGHKVCVPTVLFGGSCVFASVAHACIRRHKPHLEVSSDEELFTLPDIPGNFQMTRGQLPAPLIHQSHFYEMLTASLDAETKSDGLLMNTFYTLEAPYVDFYRNQLGRRTWNIGPLELFNKSLDVHMNSENGRGSMRGGHECLNWLDSKEPHSVIYICFGSAISFAPSQLREIAGALLNSGLSFIWVVRNLKGLNTGELSEWKPEGFEKGIKGRGMVISGWAPQVTILEHEAVGGFVTHCGWNSSLEAISAGVPLVTWPMVAEQFFNEMLLTQVLKVGVSVGANKWGSMATDVTSEAIEKAMVRLMVGEEAADIRNRARELASSALAAVQGGSSSCDLEAFMDKFSKYK